MDTDKIKTDNAKNMISSGFLSLAQRLGMGGNLATEDHSGLSRMYLTQIYQEAVKTDYKGPVSLEYRVSGMGGNSLYQTKTKEQAIHPKLRSHIAGLPQNHIMHESLARFDNHLALLRDQENKNNGITTDPMACHSNRETLARLDLNQVYLAAVSTGYRGPVAFGYEIKGMGGNSLYQAKTKEETIHPKLRAHINALPAEHGAHDYLKNLDMNLSEVRKMEKTNTEASLNKKNKP